MSDQQTCKSGKHQWIPENIYAAPSGAYRSCRLCTRESARERRASGIERGHVRAAGLPKERPEFDHPLSEKELRYMRSLIPCVGCGQTPEEDGWVRHWLGCSVPYNREGINPVGRPRTKPVSVKVPKRCTICEQEFTPERGRNAAQTCSEECSAERKRRRNEAKYAAMRTEGKARRRGQAA